MEYLMQTNIAEQAHTVEFLPAANRSSSLPGTRFWYVMTGAVLLGISMCMGNSVEAQQTAAPSSPVQQAAARRVTQIVLPASLVTSLDSKKQKTGAEVIVKIAGTLTLKDGTSI